MRKKNKKKGGQKEIRGCPVLRPMSILLHLMHEQEPHLETLVKLFFVIVKIS